MADILGTTGHIDPIKVREERERFSHLAQSMQNGAKAADALLWFSEHVKPGKFPTVRTSEVVRLKAEVVAGATPNAQDANEYLRRAVEHFVDAILVKAIELAQTGFKSAEQLRKGD